MQCKSHSQSLESVNYTFQEPERIIHTLEINVLLTPSFMKLRASHFNLIYYKLMSLNYLQNYLSVLKKFHSHIVPFYPFPSPFQNSRQYKIGTHFKLRVKAQIRP